MSERAKKLWLRAHGAGEKRFADAVEAFLKKQATRLALSCLGRRDRNAASIVRIAFRLDKEHEEFMKVVKRQLLQLLTQGAEAEQEAAPKKTAELRTFELKTFELKEPNLFDIDDSDDFDLPKPVLANIRVALDDLEQQSYWKQIQETTRSRMAGIVERGIQDGEALQTIADRIEAALGGQAKGRALAIARTETTGALNAGHFAARKELIADGLVTGSEWVTVEDADTRETHSEADGQIAKDDDLFNVGGESCRFPGDWSLSAGERVNCRCTTIASGTFAD